MAVAFRASATSTAATITIPAGAAAGDFAFLMQQSAHSTTVASVIPTGWTAIPGTFNTGSAGSPETRWLGAYKVLEAGDPGASITGMDGDVNDQKIMVVFYGATPLSGIAFGDVLGAVNSGDIASDLIDADVGTAPLIVIGVSGCNDFAATFSTASPAFDAQLTAGNLRLGYKLYTSSPADHTIDKTDEGQRNFLGGFYVTVRETQALTPSLVTGAATVPSATIGGTYDLTPTLVAGAVTVPSATVTPGAVGLTPSLVVDGDTFFSPTVESFLAIDPSLFANTNTFYTPTVTPGPVGLTASLVTNSPTVHSATVLSVYALIPALFVGGTFAVYSPAVMATADIAPSLFANTPTVHAATVLSTYDLVQGATFIGTSSIFGPTVGATYNLSPALFTNTNNVYSPQRIALEYLSERIAYVGAFDRTVVLGPMSRTVNVPDD